MNHNYRGRYNASGTVEVPRHLIGSRLSEQRRTVKALVRFDRWEKLFSKYGDKCPLGMTLTQASIGAF